MRSRDSNEPDDSRTSHKNYPLHFSPRFDLSTDKRSDSVRTGLSKKIGSHWSWGPWNWRDVPPFQTRWRSDWRVYKMVYRITYLVLDCHATLSGHSTRRGKPDRNEAKPDKLLAGSPIFSPFRGLNTESCSNFIEPTGRNRLVTHR